MRVARLAHDLAEPADCRAVGLPGRRDRRGAGGSRWSGRRRGGRCGGILEDPARKPLRGVRTLLGRLARCGCGNVVPGMVSHTGHRIYRCAGPDRKPGYPARGAAGRAGGGLHRAAGHRPAKRGASMSRCTPGFAARGILVGQNMAVMRSNKQGQPLVQRRCFCPGAVGARPCSRARAPADQLHVGAEAACAAGHHYRGRAEPEPGQRQARLEARPTEPGSRPISGASPIPATCDTWPGSTELRCRVRE